jgi:hypothetical protein
MCQIVKLSTNFTIFYVQRLMCLVGTGEGARWFGRSGAKPSAKEAVRRCGLCIPRQTGGPAQDDLVGRHWLSHGLQAAGGECLQIRFDPAQFEALFAGLDWRRVTALETRPPAAAE